jgi:hypothetical protein
LILLPPPPCWDCRHALLHAALHLFFFGNTGAHLLGRHSTAWPRLHPFYSGCFGATQAEIRRIRFKASACG